MTLSEQIQYRLAQLPEDKQLEALDFIEFLAQRSQRAASPGRRSLKSHPAFGAWRARQIDAVQYQQTLRAEWEDR